MKRKEEIGKGTVMSASLARHIRLMRDAGRRHERTESGGTSSSDGSRRVGDDRLKPSRPFAR